ncbi:sialic acid-binding Ig-like lectin 16 [Stegastes partitus]|uniref:Sialic acid-binding Ig-like lectin 16 n=1 Tax=Stegastes partitus TaxID=144197 RepID=A0A3B5B0T4_9TELE|nr:PREDICTED: sialic acid-binding Ig-like lectin 16 [Stegastes partitus]XP_008285113.1 PREDICTED: sialic acid-binding Ig-like lectin 16 [Stegastes partitus]
MFCALCVKKMIAVLVLLIIKPGTINADWSVRLENPNPCAVKGSSVELRCSYNYPDGETVQKTAWYKGDLVDGLWKRVALSHLPSYQNRSEYVGDLQHNCSLALHDLQNDDAGYYYFRFDTNTYGRHSKTSVYLTVTELKARVHPERVRAGDNVTLECGASCQLPNTVWFKNGHPVSKPNFTVQAEDAGNYLCAVEGQESVQSDPVTLDVQYSPLNVTVEVSQAGLLMVGSSVNLTCSSVANPAADSYTWYRSTSPSSLLQVGSGQVLSLPSVEASHTGLYFCQTRNRLGESNSTHVLLTVTETDNHRLILLVGIGVKVAILLLLPLLVIWIWRQWRNSASETENHDYENIRAIKRVEG